MREPVRFNHLRRFVILEFVFYDRLRNEKWMDVEVGDIIKLQNNQFVTVRTDMP